LDGVRPVVSDSTHDVSSGVSNNSIPTPGQIVNPSVGIAGQSVDDYLNTIVPKATARDKSGRKKGVVRGEGVSIYDLMNTFNDVQGKAFAYLSTVAEVTGIDIVLYRSEAGPDGKFQGAQGKYSRSKPGTIYIDLNAGLSDVKSADDLAKYAMLRTFAHEFTHFIENWNPTQYNEFREVVFNTLAQRGENVQDLIEDKMACNPGMSPDSASREVVAEAMTDILPDSKFVQELAVKHQDLFHRLVEKLKAFVSNLRQYFDTVGKNPSTEANALKEQVGETVKYLDSIVQLFDQMAVQAVENYQQSVYNGETTLDSVAEDGVQYQTRDNLDKTKPKKRRKRSTYSETESLFMMWSNGSAPAGEVKRFTRFGKHRYYQKTETGCVELSRAQYNERTNRDAEKTYGRIQRQVNGTADPDGNTQRNLSGSLDRNRDRGGASAVPRQAFGEELRNDARRGVSGVGRNHRGTAITNNEDTQHQQRTDTLTDRKNLSPDNTVDDRVQYQAREYPERRSDRPNRRRALLEGEMINEFHDALTDQEWHRYFDRIKKGKYDPDLFEDNDLATVAVNGKFLLVQMQPNGEFSVIAAWKYHETLPPEDVIKEMTDYYATRNYGKDEIVSWLSRLTGDDGQKLFVPYNRHSGQYDGDAQQSSSGGRDADGVSAETWNNGKGLLEVSARPNVADDYTQNQQRTDTLTDRDVLAKAAEQVELDNLTPEEKDSLRAFQTHHRELKKLQNQLWEQQGQETAAVKTQQSRSQIAALKEEIKKKSQELANLEKQPLLQQVRSKALPVIEAQLLAEQKARLEKYRKQYGTIPSVGAADSEGYGPLSPADIADAAVNAEPVGPAQTAQDTVKGAVALAKETGKVSNSQAERILQTAGAVEYLQQYIDITLPGTASGNRATIKDAVMAIANTHGALDVDENQSSPDPVKDTDAWLDTIVPKANQQQNSTQTTAPEQTGVKTQLRANQDKLNSMQAVAQVDIPDNYYQMSRAEKITWIAKKLQSTGYKVDRKGFGVIDFAVDRIKKAFRYFGRYSIEDAAFEAIPYILQYGEEISSHENHKGRDYGTVTFAAPVVINGRRGNMAVVVTRTNGNHYKVHRVLTPDGSEFVLDDAGEKTKQNPPGRGSRRKTVLLPRPRVLLLVIVYATPTKLSTPLLVSKVKASMTTLTLSFPKLLPGTNPAEKRELCVVKAYPSTIS